MVSSKKEAEEAAKLEKEFGMIDDDADDDDSSTTSLVVLELEKEDGIGHDDNNPDNPALSQRRQVEKFNSSHNQSNKKFILYLFMFGLVAFLGKPVFTPQKMKEMYNQATNNKNEFTDDSITATDDQVYKEDEGEDDHANDDYEHKNDENRKTVGGFVVLGMHRSGTSMLTGLLVEGFGYDAGEPLVSADSTNAKGFFELWPVVHQNDYFMENQNVSYWENVEKYDAELALERYYTGTVPFDKGTKALDFLNNEKRTPWIQKDPRMCITLRTWLPLLDSKPAVLFTYRKPLSVAKSLHKRDGLTLAYGLKLWILYNKGSLQNSAGLCRVYTKNSYILADALEETKRIVDELTNKCNVPPPPSMINHEIVDGFVDASLQHDKEKNDEQKEILVINGDDCIVMDYNSLEKDGSEAQKIERKNCI